MCRCSPLLQCASEIALRTNSCQISIVVAVSTSKWSRLRVLVRESWAGRECVTFETNRLLSVVLASSFSLAKLLQWTQVVFDDAEDANFSVVGLVKRSQVTSYLEFARYFKFSEYNCFFFRCCWWMNLSEFQVKSSAFKKKNQIFKFICDKKKNETIKISYLVCAYDS